MEVNHDGALLKVMVPLRNLLQAECYEKLGSAKLWGYSWHHVY